MAPPSTGPRAGAHATAASGSEFEDELIYDDETVAYEGEPGGAMRPSHITARPPGRSDPSGINDLISTSLASLPPLEAEPAAPGQGLGRSSPIGGSSVVPGSESLWDDSHIGSPVRGPDGFALVEPPVAPSQPRAAGLIRRYAGFLLGVVILVAASGLALELAAPHLFPFEPTGVRPLAVNAAEYLMKVLPPLPRFY